MEQDDTFFADTCDESKCVSKGRSNLHGDSFTCYGDDGTFYPMICADGFIPKIVEDEPYQNHTGWFGQLSVSYFTCCPPKYLSSNTTDDQDVYRQCSDPIAYTTGDDDDSDCNTNSTKTYRRDMKTSRGMVTFGRFDFIPTKTDAFLCCDSPPALEERDFLQEVECVPYRSEFYESKKAQNLIGVLRVISCDFPEGDFVYPRPMPGKDHSHVVATGMYQCCKEGPALQPFIKDDAFKITAYPVLSIMSISVVLSAITAVALLIPLILQLKDGTFGKRDGSRKSSAIRSKKEPCYSTFNLYLVYLSVADLVYGSFHISSFVAYINQRFNPSFFSIYASPTNLVNPNTMIRGDGPITLTYIFINMWINTVISYQLLILLQKSQSGRRIDQPSLRRVNIQVGVILFAAALYCSALYALRYVSWRAGNNFDVDTMNTIAGIVKVTWIAMIIIPFVFLAIMTGIIWYRGYVPRVDKKASTRDRAMRQLVVFFLRIVAVFVVIWFPSVLIVILGILKFQPLFFLLSWLLVGFQPILSFCVVMTKYDARRYTYNLITLSYFFKKKRNSSFSSSRSQRYGSYNSSSQRNGTCKSERDYTSSLHASSYNRNGSSKKWKSTFSVASGIGVPHVAVKTGMDNADSDDMDIDGLCFSVLGFVPESIDENDVEGNEDSLHLEKGVSALMDDNCVQLDVEDSANAPDRHNTEGESTPDFEESEQEIVFFAEDSGHDQGDPSQLSSVSTGDHANPNSSASVLRLDDRGESNVE